MLEEGAKQGAQGSRERSELKGHECESMLGNGGKKGCLERMQGICWRGKREWE